MAPDEEGDSNSTASGGEPMPASLEVGTDSSSNEADSALGMSFQDSSTSVRSSIYNFLVENGRSYHAYKSGKYLLPNDTTEQERLDLQHHSFKIMLNGKLNLAPVKNPKNVLDIGTGTGIWAIEFAHKHEQASVVGMDLSPIQPELIPPNCRFEVADAEEEDWNFSEQFDFIHGRALVTCFKNPRSVVERIYKNLAPGGYFELQDPCLPLRCDDGTLEGTALAEWNRLMYEGMLQIGKDLKENLSYGQYMRDVGFEDVVETHTACAFNTWPKGDKNKLLGALSMHNLLEGVDSMSRALFTRVFGWSADRLEEFLVQVKEDLKNRKVHVYCGVYFVHGRKPLVEKEAEPASSKAEPAASEAEPAASEAEPAASEAEPAASEAPAAEQTTNEETI